MSTWTFENPVCPKCSHNEIKQGCCHHDEDDRWWTRTERRGNPEGYKEASTQKSMWVSDPTACDCVKCGYEYPEKAFLELRKKFFKGPFMVREETGMAVVNLRGIEKVK